MKNAAFIESDKQLKHGNQRPNSIGIITYEKPVEHQLESLGYSASQAEQLSDMLSVKVGLEVVSGKTNS